MMTPIQWSQSDRIAYDGEGLVKLGPHNLALSAIMRIERPDATTLLVYKRTTRLVLTTLSTAIVHDVLEKLPRNEAFNYPCNSAATINEEIAHYENIQP